ncbi:MAG: AraC family transcriptional regulator [Clostridiales bacterium]|nr:AraC family transcriptional regulator [Clostridiales bacterium]
MIYFELRSNDMYTKKKEYGALKFLDCGKIHVSRGWRHKSRFMECYELLFVLKGRLNLTVGEQPFTVSETQLFLIPPYHRMRGHLKSPGEIEFYWIDFNLENAGNLPFPAPMQPFDVGDGGVLQPFFEMLRESGQEGGGGHYIRASLLMAILYLASRSRGESRVKTPATEAMHYIDSRLSQPLSARDVADALNYNKDYISRSIKGATGLTLKEYIIRRKMDTARTLLRTSALSIDEIGRQTGFEEGNLFTKFFTYHQGTSPSAYRKGME